jgi:hypothetical protein
LIFFTLETLFVFVGVAMRKVIYMSVTRWWIWVLKLVLETLLNSLAYSLPHKARSFQNTLFHIVLIIFLHNRIEFSHKAFFNIMKYNFPFSKY